MGRVAVAMAKRNPFEVLGHDVALPDGTVVHNAFRVSPCGDGCLPTFVAVRQPGVGPEQFANDVAHVHRDLRALKRLLEGWRIFASASARRDHDGHVHALPNHA